ncbi:MAG: NAD kinase [Saprospiraceae bacterium]
MMKIFLFGIKIKTTSELDFVRQVFDVSVKENIAIQIYKPFHKELLSQGLDMSSWDVIGTRTELIRFNPDVAMVMGGDGTILKVATFIQDSNIPVLGINLGRLGFLASVEKNSISKAMKQLKSKKFTIESRSLISLKSNKQIFADFPFALNDFTLHKRDNSSMITIHVYVDGIPLNAYWADGIIVSTPTGSTGYSLSCGGPIVFPNASNFIITAVAPHNLNVRPIVLSDQHKISFRIEGRSDNFMCTLDGRYETVTADHTIEIQKADFSFGMVQLEGQNFMKTLSEKLWWGMDKRN